jgi:hypothetical protein
MNQLFIICGLLFGQEATMPQEETEPYVRTQNVTPVEMVATENEVVNDSTANVCFLNAGVNEPADIDLNNIVYIEEEEEVDLGFDPAIFLPEGFNPHEAYFDIHSIQYVEETPEVIFDFDTCQYLPENFDANAYYFDIHSIDFIDSEKPTVVNMGYDITAYLPRGFNPDEPYLNLNSIEYIEDEEEIVTLGFDTRKYLPSGFNPYQRKTNL